jgi:hypothetical protein
MITVILNVFCELGKIEIFGSFSGLLLSRNKTEGEWIGKLKNCKYKIAGINWADKPIKSLGHTLAKNVNRGKINDLINNFFPNIERFLFPYAQNSLFIFSILFSQFRF